MPFLRWLFDRLPKLVRPIIPLSIAISCFIMTVFDTVFRQFRPFAVLNIHELKLRSFANLWKAYGEAMSRELPGPLNQLLSTSKGVVLDVGPGSGELLNRFNPEHITTIYGAEPASDLHPGLWRSVKRNGFEGKYHALLCGVEPESLIPALHKDGIINLSGNDGMAENGVFDEICCLRVLCSVPHPQQTIKALYTLLKPGGRMVICEHVVSPWSTHGSFAARIAQVAYSLMGWSFFHGGCRLQQHTYEYLREAGQWERFDLNYYSPKDLLPYIVGEMIKSGKATKNGLQEESYTQAAKS